MKKIMDDKAFYLRMARYAFFMVLISWLFTSCDKITGSDDDDTNTKTEQPEPNPEPQQEAAKISSFSVSDDLISEGETVTLSWEVTGDEPITLTLEPGSIDVSDENNTDVTPIEDTTFRLIAENDAGSDESDISVRVIPAGVIAIEVEINGLPGGVEANIAITNFEDYMQWVSDNNALTEVPAGPYTVAAAPVKASGSTYIPNEGIQMIDVAKAYSNTTLIQVNYSSNSESLYADQPDLQECHEGAITELAKERGLMYLNFIRALTGLPPVIYDYDSDEMVQKAALIMAANSELSHFPPEDWHCYSETGADGAETSNLGIDLSNSKITSTPETFMSLYSNDWRVPSLGHRRWLLDPFLKEIAIGHVEGTPIKGSNDYAAGNAVRVVGGSMADIDDLELPFIAYPRGDFPSDLFTDDWFFSFSVIANTNGRYSNDDEVDYSNTDIMMKDDNENVLSVTEIMIDHTAYGIPNIIQWKAPNMKKNRDYTISITGVKVNGQTRNFEYEVNLQ